MGGRILVADDHPLTREGIALAARAAVPGATVIGAGSIAEAATAMKARPAFRLIALDLHLPDAQGFSGLLTLQHRDPSVPIVVVTAHEDPALIDAARAIGAAGFVSKSLPLDDIAGIFRRLVLGGTHFRSAGTGVSTIERAQARIADLTPAQREVLLALADGRSNKQMARTLAVTEATVKAHLTTVFRKLGVANRMQALLAVQPLLGSTRAGSAL